MSPGEQRAIDGLIDKGPTPAGQLDKDLLARKDELSWLVAAFQYLSCLVMTISYRWWSFVTLLVTELFIKSLIYLEVRIEDNDLIKVCFSCQPTLLYPNTWRMVGSTFGRLCHEPCTRRLP